MEKQIVKNNTEARIAISCDFELCSYNYNKKCVLDTIHISGFGACESCIIPDFPKELIKQYKIYRK